MDRITIVYIKPNQKPCICTIAKTQGRIEQMVGGYVEEYLPNEFKSVGINNIFLFCNEDAYLHGLPINYSLNLSLTIRGNIVIAKREGNQLLSLNKEEINILLKILKINNPLNVVV
ncbi:DUF3846 domain-containing protein [Metabacillus niabensis]|uniref:DUF3846 domain-containing protein n=1 Tax=Metabacillus niabensis TaxID=324854 RepID=UPI0039A2CC2C